MAKQIRVDAAALSSELQTLRLAEDCLSISAYNGLLRTYRTKKCEVPSGGGKGGGLASGGQLKSSHLVELQRIKAVVTEGLGERAASTTMCSSG